MHPVGRRSLSVFASLVIVAPILLGAGCASRSADRVEATIATFADGGLAVYAGYDTQAPLKALAGPRSAMRLTRWQLTNLLDQASAGMGMLGADIDRLEGSNASKRIPPFSAFLGAWLTRGDSPLARYAQTLMAPKADYHRASRVTFPTLAVILFVADAARVGPTASPTPVAQSFDFEKVIAAPARADGVCSAVSTFITSTITDVENALTISSGGFFATLWNVAIKLVSGIAQVLIGGVLVPLLHIVTVVAGGLALITTIASTLQPWTVSMEEDPQSVSLGADPVSGTFTAVLHAPSIDWPNEVADCANVLGGVDLKNIGSKDASVAWQTFGEMGNLAKVEKQAATVGSNDRAELAYATVSMDTSHAQCSSLRPSGFLGARASVERQDIVRLQQQLFNLVMGQMPAFVRNNLAPLFAPWINSATTSFKNLLASPVTGTGTTEVWELVQDPLKCTAPPAQEPSSAPAPPGVDDTALLGIWHCSAEVTVETLIGPTTVAVTPTADFHPNGVVGGSIAIANPSSQFGPAGSHQKVVYGHGQGKPELGSSTYAYLPETETIRWGGIDQKLIWNGTSAWSIQEPGRKHIPPFLLTCKR